MFVRLAVWVRTPFDTEQFECRFHSSCLFFLLPRPWSDCEEDRSVHFFRLTDLPLKSSEKTSFQFPVGPSGFGTAAEASGVGAPRSAGAAIRVPRMTAASTIQPPRRQAGRDEESSSTISPRFLLLSRGAHSDDSIFERGNIWGAPSSGVGEPTPTQILRSYLIRVTPAARRVCAGVDASRCRPSKY